MMNKIIMIVNRVIINIRPYQIESIIHNKIYKLIIIIIIIMVIIIIIIIKMNNNNIIK